MHSMLPFLCLGIGIDDMFVIVQVVIMITVMIVMIISMMMMMVRIINNMIKIRIANDQSRFLCTYFSHYHNQ